MTARRHAGCPPAARRLAAGLAVGTLALAGCGADGPDTTDGPRTGTMRPDRTREPERRVDGVNVEHGRLEVDPTQRYGGARVFRASVHGPRTAYSRAIAAVDWRPGADVWYAAGFLLPRGFRAAMQGEVDLMRWDNWPDDQRHTDRGGVALFHGDGRGHLVRHRERVEHVDIAPTFALPEGRWFWLEVHQRLADGPGALNEVYVDGRLVASSRAPNSYGRPVRRIRFGIVASDTGVQQQPLHLWFAGAAAAGRRIGPPAGHRS